MAATTTLNPQKKMCLFRNYVKVLELLRPYPYHLHINNLFGRLLLEARGVLAGAAEIRNAWIARADSGRLGPVNLYLGTPFCASRCSYCIYYKGMPSGEEELRDYAAALQASVSYYAEVFERVSFRHVYFGGGTPSLLPEAQLRALCEELSSRVRRESGGECTIEVNPTSLTPAKLKSMATFFKKLSVGVQSLDGRVLRLAGRGGQTRAGVKKAFEAARKAGFEEISADMLRGLYGDTGPQFLRSLETLFSFGPDIVKLYPLFPDSAYLDRHYGGSMESFLASAATHEKFFIMAMELAQRKGYELPPILPLDVPIHERFIEFTRHGALKEGYTFRSEDSPQSVFGLGHHANSCLRGIMHYHSVPLKADPRRNEYRAMHVSETDEMRRYALAAFSSFKPLSAGKFKDLFGRDFSAAFEDEISALSSLSMLHAANGLFSLLPKNPAERLACAMFFLDFKELSACVMKFASDKTARQHA